MSDEKAEIKNILKKLKSREVSEDVKEKAKKFLKGLDASALGMLEQELIEEGVSQEEIRKNLCDIHLEVMKEDLIKGKIKVQSPHPIHTLMEEHKIIVKNLKELSELIERMKCISSFEDFKEMESLKEIAHVLIDAENHHKREEEVLFPRLRKHGIIEPPNIMEMEHKEFIKAKRKLFQVVSNPEDYDFESFKKEISEKGEFISKELQSHIFKEDNILYQMALQALDEKEWDEVKKENDKIGYCCFKPAE